MLSVVNTNEKNHRIKGLYHQGIQLPPDLKRWEGGTGVFVEALIKQITSKGASIFASCPVKEIKQPHFSAQDEQQQPQPASIYPVQVTVLQKGCAGSESQERVINAKHVIVATAPTAAADIDYVPELPADAAHLFSSMEATPVVSYNIILVYSSPWWREQGKGKCNCVTIMSLC